jgi:hypothetical protein
MFLDRETLVWTAESISVAPGCSVSAPAERRCWAGTKERIVESLIPSWIRCRCSWISMRMMTIAYDFAWPPMWAQQKRPLQ